MFQLRISALDLLELADPVQCEKDSKISADVCSACEEKGTRKHTMLTRICTRVLLFFPCLRAGLDALAYLEAVSSGAWQRVYRVILRLAGLDRKCCV